MKLFDDLTEPTWIDYVAMILTVLFLTWVR